MSRGPKKKAKRKKNTNFIGEIRKCFFLITIEHVEAKPQYKAAGLRMAWETFASASAIKAEQTDGELCLEFVNIASATSFLKVRSFPPSSALGKPNKALVYKSLGNSWPATPVKLMNSKSLHEQVLRAPLTDVKATPIINNLCQRPSRKLVWWLKTTSSKCFFCVSARIPVWGASSLATIRQRRLNVNPSWKGHSEAMGNATRLRNWELFGVE